MVNTSQAHGATPHCIALVCEHHRGMELQALSTQHRIVASAPPPPMRRRLHVPTEPLLFAAVVLLLTLGMAKALPQPAAGATDVTSQPITTTVATGPAA